MRFDDISEGLKDPKDNPCWKGYHPVGTKKKNGRTVPNCVPKESVEEGLTDEVNPADVGEYDREGDMAKQDLSAAADAANELRSILDSDENLPEWVQAKITKAVDYLDTARDYMKGKEEQSVTDVTEVSSDTLKSYQQKVSADSMKHPSDPTKRSPSKASRSVAGFAKAQKRLEKGVAEAGWGRRSGYYNPMDQERREQDAMDQSKRDFKRAELQHELGHEDDPNFERNLRQQQIDRDRGPWYIRIDGKIYRQKGQPKSFDWKRGANNYALAMIKNNPSLQGKIMLTKSAEDK